MCISGLRQLVGPTPASAIDAPISFRKSRRDHSSSLSSEAPAGNSRSSHSRNSGVSLSSCKLRQYFLPVSGSGGCCNTRFMISSGERTRLACTARRLAERTGSAAIGQKFGRGRRNGDARSRGLPRTAAFALVVVPSLSVACLAIFARRNVPAFFQRLADLLLCEMLLLGPIFGHALWLSVLRDELRRLHVVGFPVEIENLVIGSQKIFRVAMALQTPGHAHRFGVLHDRHVIDVAMATEATDPAINVRGVIVKNVIRQPMDPDPGDRLLQLPW